MEIAAVHGKNGWTKMADVGLSGPMADFHYEGRAGDPDYQHVVKSTVSGGFGPMVKALRARTVEDAVREVMERPKAAQTVLDRFAQGIMRGTDGRLYSARLDDAVTGSVNVLDGPTFSKSFTGVFVRKTNPALQAVVGLRTWVDLRNTKTGRPTEAPGQENARAVLAAGSPSGFPSARTPATPPFRYADEPGWHAFRERHDRSKLTLDHLQRLYASMRENGSAARPG